MARKFLTPIDLSKLEIQNVAAQNVASFPASPAVGQFVFRTDLKKFYVYTGDAGLGTSGWVATDGADIPDGTITSAKILDGTIVDADINASAGILATKLDTASFNTKVQANRLDQLSAPTASVSLNSQKITNLADPTNDTDAANKRYVDSAVVGINWKPSVRAATTTEITLSGEQTVDDVVLVAGDRVLVKNQSTAANNGIYVVVSGGAWTRSTDADTSAELTASFAVFVEEGTSNADSGWVLTVDGDVTVGVTALTFTQFTGLGQVTAGNGLTKSGNVIDVVGTSNRISVTADAVDIAATYVGQTSITTLGTITTGTWNGTDIAVADGGTGASTAADARTNLSNTTNPLPQKYTASVGGSTSIAVTHNLGTTDVVVSTYLSNALVECDVTTTDANTVTLGFAVAPTAGSIRVVVIG
jgi:hypothetical protein